MLSSEYREEEYQPVVDADLLSRKLTCMTAPTLVRKVDEACRLQKKIVVANYNVNSFNLSVQFPWFYEFLQRSEITHCDGLGILYALRFMGYNLPKEYRVSYTSLMPRLLNHCNENNISIFLLGARPEILRTALDRVRLDYPNIRLAGHHGYFLLEDEKQNKTIVDEINKVNPNILIVGMGMPRQEYWIRRFFDQINVNVVLPGGAVIDRLAGVVEDCPPLLSNNGLEWLFRLSREPKRLLARYLFGNPAFVLQVVLAKYQSVSIR